MTNVVFYATETMSDWEYGYLLAGLQLAERQAPGRLRIVVAGADGVGPVRSLGGLTVLPDTALSALDPATTALLVLPGATTWDDPANEAQALTFARDVLAAGGRVAAICGATFGLARSGLLDDRLHTSNAADYLAAAPGYAGAELYRESRTVVDRGMITAPAIAPIDFARAVMAELEAFPANVLDAWYGLYTTGERRYFEALYAA